MPPKGKANQSYQGTPAEIPQQLVTANAIAPEDSRRVIPHLILGDRPSSGGSITYETCYNILTEDIRSIAECLQPRRGDRAELEGAASGVRGAAGRGSHGGAESASRE